MGERGRAIWDCLRFGIRPWWMYEDEPHHDLAYIRHLWINVAQIARLLARSDFGPSYAGLKPEVWWCPSCGNAVGSQWSERARCAGSVVTGDAHEPCDMVLRRLA